MSIFKDTFRNYVRNQLSLREELIDGGNTNENTGRISNRLIKRDLTLNPKTPSEKNITLDAGAYYTYALNKQCVIRMTSLVDYVEDVNLDIGDLGSNSFSRLRGAALSQNFILQGGILSDYARNIVRDDQLKREVRRVDRIRDSFPRPGLETNIAYGDFAIGGDAGSDGYGIVPMPGITDANIRTKSAYGSLREAKVTFEVHNQRQLEVMEMLYMRPGYMVLLEWGWCPYINNNGKIINSLSLVEDKSNGKIYTNDITQQEVFNHINNLKETQSGNYDGLLAIVKNFGFQAREDGGYQCFTELISMGEVLESLKTPNVATFSPGIGGTLDNTTTNSNIIIKGRRTAGTKDIAGRDIDQGDFRNAINDGVFPNENGLKGLIQGLNNYVTFNAGAINSLRGGGLGTTDSEINQELEKIFPEVNKVEGTEAEVQARNNKIKLINDAGASAGFYYSSTPLSDLDRRDYLLSLLRFQAASVDEFLVKQLGLSSSEELKNYIISRGGAREHDDIKAERKEGEFRNDQAFIRWDALTILINNALIPKDQKANNPFSIVTDRIYHTSKNKKRLDPLLFCGIGTYDNISKNAIFDFSCDPNVCILPNQLIVDVTEQGNVYDRRNIKDILGYIPDIGIIPFDYITAKYEAENIEYKGNLIPTQAKLFLTETDKVRRIGSIFLNLDMLLNIAEKNADNDEYTVGNFISDIWKEVNNVCPNHNFVFTDDKEANLGFIIDLPVDNTELPVNDLHEFIPFSNKNILRNFEYTSNVPNALTSTIAIQAQDVRSMQDIDGVTFAAFNRSIKNRLLSTDTRSNYAITRENLKSSKSSLLEEQVSLKNKLKIYFNNFFRNIKLKALDAEIIGEGNIMGTLKQYQKNAAYFATAYTNKATFNSVIPLEFTATLDGISGIVIGNVFKIKKDRLPKAYSKTDIGFIVFNEEQKISAGGDWTTDISGKMIILPDAKEPVKFSGLDVDYPVPEEFKDFATEETTAERDSDIEGQARPTDIAAVPIEGEVFLKRVTINESNIDSVGFDDPEVSEFSYDPIGEVVGFTSVRTSPSVGSGDDNNIGMFNSFDLVGSTGFYNSPGAATLNLGEVVEKEIDTYGDNTVKIKESAKAKYLKPEDVNEYKGKTLVIKYKEKFTDENDGQQYYKIKGGLPLPPNKDRLSQNLTIDLSTGPNTENWPGLKTVTITERKVRANGTEYDSMRSQNNKNIERKVLVSDTVDEKHIWFRIRFNPDVDDLFLNGWVITNSSLGNPTLYTDEADNLLEDGVKLSTYSENNPCWMRDDVLAPNREQAEFPSDVGLTEDQQAQN